MLSVLRVHCGVAFLIAVVGVVSGCLSQGSISDSRIKANKQWENRRLSEVLPSGYMVTMQDEYYEIVPVENEPAIMIENELPPSVTGTVISKDRKGVVQYSAIYKMGKGNGPRRIWDSRGRLLNEEIYKDGKLIKEKCFLPSPGETPRDGTFFTVEYSSGIPAQSEVWGWGISVGTNACGRQGGCGLEKGDISPSQSYRP